MASRYRSLAGPRISYRVSLSQTQIDWLRARYVSVGEGVRLLVDEGMQHKGARAPQIILTERSVEELKRRHTKKIEQMTRQGRFAAKDGDGGRG